MKTFSTSLLLTSFLPSILALPIFLLVITTIISLPGRNYISLTGAYDFKSKTLSAVLLDEGVATCTINTAPSAATATFLFNCEEGCSALIPGDLREIRYQAAGSDDVVVPQTTVDHENTREFVVSEVC